MKILITGGAGFIGGYFAEQLIKQGHQIVSLDIAPPSAEVAGVKYLIGDIRDQPLVTELANGCDSILHLAAAHHDFGISTETFESVNVDGAKILCDVMDSLNINRICFYSTVAVYGSKPKPPISEATPPLPESDYGITKLKAENVFSDWVKRDASRQCLVIRPTVTFGPENYANMFTLIKQIDKGRFLKVGNGQNIKSLSYVENIVAATLQVWLGDKNNNQPWQLFNFIDKPDLTSEQITDIIYDELDRKPPRFRIPLALAKFLAIPFDIVIALTGKNLSISSARIEKLAASETKYESQSIFELGVKVPVSLEEGIRKMVRWYLDVGKHRAASEIRRSLPPLVPILSKR